MSEDSHFTATYYRDDLLVYVMCSMSGCTIDLVQPNERNCDGYHLELLLQPTDEHGWPQGQVRLLYEAEISVRPDPWSQWTRGFHRLPFRLTEEQLRRCHIRLTCNTVTEPGKSTT